MTWTRYSMGIDFDAIRPCLAELCRRYGVAELLVFGSTARGDARPDSDVDFLYARAPDNASHPGHSLENIQTALAGALPPPGCNLPFDASAFDVFAGYLLLDAWVANRDRHDNNWAVLRPATTSGAPLRLCGSYDHANSLGFNVRDDKRLWRLADQQRIIDWCEKGLADRFDFDPARGRPTLADMAVKGLRLASPAARAYWPQRLREVDDDEVRRILARVPRMSDVARTFAGTKIRKPA